MPIGIDPFSESEAYPNFLFVICQWSYESGCQGQFSPSQGVGSIFQVHDIQPLLVSATPPILQHRPE
jgi:hypothetical protein